MLISDIVPYERNARHNEKAIPVVAESIAEFGLRGQIVLESRERPVIVAGHTRVAACKSLGWTEIPDEHICFCDDLTDEQIRAYRLADNRTGEVATWNRTLLQREMSAIKSLDMSRFKFDFKSNADGFRHGQERLRTDEVYNLPTMYRYGTKVDASGQWGIPRLDPVDFVPDAMVPINYAKSYDGERPEVGIHFFKDDYQFERCWRDPERYVDVLSEYQCTIMPDFSLYVDMPLAIQVYNAYRNAFCARVWQKAGLTVVPCLLWSTPKSYGFCFDAIPRSSTVCVSTVGVMADEDSQRAFCDGMAEAMRRLEPARILIYGTAPDFDFGGVEVVNYPASVSVTRKTTL